MNPNRIPFKVMGKEHILITPRELWSSDKRVAFRTALEAEQFFREHVRETSVLSRMHSRLLQSAGASPRSETEYCQQLGSAVFAGRLFVVTPGVQSKMMPLASPRVRQKEEVQVVKKSVQEEYKPVELINPRWEHTDSQKKKSSPNSVQAGDLILLKTDSKYLAEGARVVFEIYDVLPKDTKRITSVAGKNESGTAAVEWTVKDPRKSGESRELKVIFEAVSFGKESPSASIPFESGARITDAYFEDESGVKIDRTQADMTVYLVIRSTGMTGQKASVNLADTRVNFEYQGKLLENDLLEDLTITEDSMKIELKTHKEKAANA